MVHFASVKRTRVISVISRKLCDGTVTRDSAERILKQCWREHAGEDTVLTDASRADSWYGSDHCRAVS